MAIVGRTSAVPSATSRGRFVDRLTTWLGRRRRAQRLGIPFSRVSGWKMPETLFVHGVP